jgi:hypothetical protein
MFASSPTSALVRLREQALNAAAIVAAMATSTSESVKGFGVLSSRQDEQLTEFLHDFAFKARRYLDAAAKLIPLIAPRLTQRSIAGYPESEDESASESSDVLDISVELTTYSLRFLFGRIIHSEDLRIHRSGPPMIQSRYTVPAGMPWGFTVRSDKDEGGPSHFVFIEFLLDAFLDVDEVIGPLLGRLLANESE